MRANDIESLFVELTVGIPHPSNPLEIWAQWTLYEGAD